MPTVTDGAQSTDTHGDELSPVRPRTLVIAFAIAALGVRYHTTSILHGLGASPHVPLAVLFALVALRPLLARLLGLHRQDVIVVYCVVLIALGAYDGVSRFMPAYTVPQYFAAPENSYQRLAEECIPGWFVPKAPEIIRMYYEGAGDGPAPLRAWAAPVALWILFFMALWGTLYCVVALVRRHWVEHERLAFPMVMVPLYIAGAGVGRLRPRTSVWTEPLMWVGFCIASAHFLSIMLHALNPAVPTLGTNLDVGQFFTEKPLDAFRPLFRFIYNPLLAGLAYFAPQDLCFSMWFFFLFYFKPIRLIWRVGGYQTPSGFPYYWEQSAGAFVAIAIFYAWAARGYLRRVWRSAVSGAPIQGEQSARTWADPMSPRLALCGAVCGFVAVCLWYCFAGMSWWVAAIFFALIILFATIFTRGRAESGVAYTASYPFWQASRQIKSFLGSDRLMPRGSYSNLTLLGSLIFLHFGSFPEGMTFQMESLRLGEHTRVKTGYMTAIVFAAMLLGLLVNFHTFLSTCYEWGANTLQGGTTEGGYHVRIAQREYAEVSGIVDGTPLSPDWHRNGFTILAFAFTLVLVGFHTRFPRLPLHPLGFVMTTSYGYAYWGSFLAVWALKAAILRLGGVRLYHRLAPIFVGLVLGQIFSVGVVWPIFARFAPDEWKTLADPLIYF